MSLRHATAFVGVTRRTRQVLKDTPIGSISTCIVPADHHHVVGQDRSFHSNPSSPAVRRLLERNKKQAVLSSMSSTAAASAASGAGASAGKDMGRSRPHYKEKEGKMKTAATTLGAPTMEMAKSMPLSCREMDNTSLLTLSALDVLDARAEVLRRHIMSVDDVSYEEACVKFDEINAFNRTGMLKHTVPYKIGISAALIGGFASIPMCFELNTVLWFNEHYVTTDVPEGRDLETWLEVGSWAWNWMEPPLGQMSFFLLCMQFARAQLENLGIRPYTHMMKQKRAARLVKKYPNYDARLLEDYCLCTSYY